MRNIDTMLDSFSHRQWSLGYNAKRKGFDFDRAYQLHIQANAVHIAVCPDGSIYVPSGHNGGYRHVPNTSDSTKRRKNKLPYDQWVTTEEVKILPAVFRRYLDEYFGTGDIAELEHYTNKARQMFMLDGGAISGGNINRVKMISIDPSAGMSICDAAGVCSYIAHLLIIHGRTVIQPIIAHEEHVNGTTRIKAKVIDFLDDYLEATTRHLDEFSSTGTPFTMMVAWSFFADMLEYSEYRILDSVLYPRFVRPVNNPEYSGELYRRYRDYRRK